MNEEMICHCGHSMKKEVADVTHSLFGRKITIHNVPHFVCDKCGHTWYGQDENKVIKALREAYLNNENDIECQ